MAQNTTTHFDDAKSVLKILIDAGFPSMFAGGCVRDRLLGVTPKDYDIATTAHPNDAQKLFTRKGMRVIPTGIEHGTITIVTESGPVEITTLRKDVKTDGRHAVVEFHGATFEDDAARRDFTINAMFEDINGIIHDFHGGQTDLKSRQLRFVGTPTLRIQEDYLRIMRFFRFWARLGFSPDHSALLAIQASYAGLEHVSQERITHELWAIWAAPHSADALIAMEQTGVTKVVFPECITLDHTTKVILRDATTMPERTRSWIVLSLFLGIMKDSHAQESLHTFGRRLRLSERDTRTLMAIFSGWQRIPGLLRETSAVLDFAESLEHPQSKTDLLNFFGPIWNFFARHGRTTEIQDKIGWIISTDQLYQDRRKAPLPVTGHDIMEIHKGVDGPLIGQIMSQVKRAYRNGEWQTRREGLEYLRKMDIRKKDPGKQQ